MMAQQTPLQKELALWQHASSLWCCHLDTLLGGQSKIGPASSLQRETADYTSWGLKMELQMHLFMRLLTVLWNMKVYLFQNKNPYYILQSQPNPIPMPFSEKLTAFHLVIPVPTAENYYHVKCTVITYSN
jgi:hypothetical protein